MKLSTSSNSFMQERLQYNSKKLQELLQLWVDCPTQIRSTLFPGIAQFSKLSNEAAKYEGVRYPQIFFENLCDASILALQRGEALDDGSRSSLLTAWNVAQLSIHLTDDPTLDEKLHPALIKALKETTDLLMIFYEHGEEQSDKPQKWKLILDIQKLGCKGTLATLQMLCNACSKEDLASNLRDLDEKIQLLAQQALNVRQEAQAVQSET